MPHEVRDSYSQAKIFIPTQQEKSIKQMEKDLQVKLERAEELLDKLEKKDRKENN